MSDFTPLPPSIFAGGDPEKPNASYGAIISIVLILAIVVVGAFYMWGERIHEQETLQQQAAAAAAIVTE